MSLSNFKKELESILMITSWSPSNDQLRLIASRIGSLDKPVSKSDIAATVGDVIGSYECLCQEGLDYSDLTTLLVMATKVDNDK